MSKRVLTAFFSLAAVCSAQQVRQQALGFVFDSGSSRMRPLWGVPGASTVGDPVDLGGDVSSSAVSPKQDFIVFLGGATRSAQIWMHDAQTVSGIPGIPAGATQVVLSPEGGSAAFYYPDTQQVHVVSGLPSAPVASLDADVSVLMNPLQSLAVSDDGALLLASETFVSGNAAPSVVVFPAGGVAARIGLSGSASAIAFLSNSHDVLLSSSTEAVLVRNAAAQTSRIILPAVANSAVGIISSTDGTRGFFANAQSGSVSIVSLTSVGAPPSIASCGCTPTGIARTAAPLIYRLTEDSGTPVSLLDVSSNQPRLLVIPPAAPPVLTPGNQ
jgi:hypothetical protein